MLVGWARVSTTEQSLEIQIEALREAGCEEIYQFKHSGKGKGKNNDALAEMINFVRKGDVVVCTKLDRLGRSLKEVLATIDALKDKGVSFKCLEQPVDTTKDDAFSNAMLQLLGVFAEMERSFIVERTQAGKKASGNYGGRPVKIKEAEREEIRRLASNKLLSNIKIAKMFDISEMTVRRILKEKPGFDLEQQTEKGDE